MLVIRDSQIQGFIAQSENDIVKLVCDSVIKADHERVENIRPLRLISMAKIGIERARSVGVTRPEDIAAFVALMFEISPKFYRHPAIAAVLTDGNFSIGDRIAQLPDRINDEVWEEACLAYDPKFWFPDVA